MKKSDLIKGLLVVLRDGSQCVVSNIKGEVYFVDIKDGTYIDMNCYTIDLKYSKQKEMYDVVKVYLDYTCNDLLWERKELPKLSKNERKLLEVFKELGFTHIKRDIDNDFWVSKDEYINNGDFTYWFRGMFKTLEEDERYSINELLGE